MEKKTKLRIRILIGLLVILAGILLFYTIPAMSWEEITVWDHHNWGVSDEVSVTSYSKWDSQEGSSEGYIHVYRTLDRLWAVPDELREQEIERLRWWGDEYKEWLHDQGLTKGDTIGW